MRQEKMTAKKVSVRIKNSDKRTTKDFLIHNDFILSQFDPNIKACIDEAYEDFKDVDDDDLSIDVICKLKVQ